MNGLIALSIQFVQLLFFFRRFKILTMGKIYQFSLSNSTVLNFFFRKYTNVTIMNGLKWLSPSNKFYILFKKIHNCHNYELARVDFSIQSVQLSLFFVCNIQHCHNHIWYEVALSSNPYNFYFFLFRKYKIVTITNKFVTKTKVKLVTIIKTSFLI